MSSALEDVVVVDLTTEWWSALGAAVLGDFGAQVIRIEDLSRPERDPNRDGMYPTERFDANAELIHRNKRSLGVDLSGPAGCGILTHLLREADVLLTDLPFQTLDERGWTYAELTKENAGLIYVRGSGFGPKGPDRHLRALDELAAARTGVMPTLPQPGEPPVYTGSGQMYTAVMLAFGATVALHHRAETGEGQVVDASLFGGNLYAAALTLDAYLAMRDDRLSEPISRLDAGNPMSGAGLAYPTSDDRWVTLTMPDSDRWWPSFSEMMGIDTDDPRFNSHDKRCGESRHELMQLLEVLFAKQTGAHWRVQFNERQLSADIMEKYDYPAGDRQAHINRYILDLEHPSYGRYQSVGFPIHMSETPARLRRMAPGVGQHSAEILNEVLGYADAEIAQLEDDSVIGATRAADLQSGVSSVSASAADAGVTEADAAVPKALALAGIRVLDLTVWFQGPVCAQHLADFGAEVIHVERAESGDQARGVRSINAVPVAEWNQYFLVVNRNKKSLAIDLKTDGGREVLHKLVAESDVFLWNQGMAALETLGLDHETLAAINPRLIYATNTGYGHRGSNKPAFDMTVQALTGIMTRLGEPGQPPIYLGLGAGDAYGGLMSALGILLALHRRRETGKGQHVDASLLGAQLFLAAPTLQSYLATGKDYYSSQRSRLRVGNPLWNCYGAKDQWLFLCQENTDESWSRLCDALEREDLTIDDRFADTTKRADHAAALIGLLDEALAMRTVAEWMERFDARGITASPIVTFKDVAEDEQAWANDYFVRGHCNEVNGEVEYRGLPLTLSKTPGRIETLGPELGQDTELILLDTLGYEWDEIAALKEQGAIP